LSIEKFETEYRNPKQIRNSTFKKTNRENAFEFEALDLFRNSGFVLRI